MDIIARLILLLLYLFFGLVGIRSEAPVRPEQAPEQPPIRGDQGVTTVKSPIVVENVEVIVMESFPMQIQLQISGFQPDGCQLPIMIDQRREGNIVYVEVYRDLDPAMMCPMVVVPVEETITLEGGFEPGTYEIHVNDQVQEITL